MRTKIEVTEKKTKPVTVVIKGELAAKIRTAAGRLGTTPAAFARLCTQLGEASTDPSPEAAEDRIQGALLDLLNSGRQFVEVLPQSISCVKPRPISRSDHRTTMR